MDVVLLPDRLSLLMSKVAVLKIFVSMGTSLLLQNLLGKLIRRHCGPQSWLYPCLQIDDQHDPHTVQTLWNRRAAIISFGKGYYRVDMFDDQDSQADSIVRITQPCPWGVCIALFGSDVALTYHVDVDLNEHVR